MSRRGTRAWALAAGLLVASTMVEGAAHDASPCDDPRPGVGTPARVPLFGPADFGTSQEACARTRVALESRGALLVAERDFYGTLLAGTQVRATVALARGTWLSVVMPGIEYRFVANATVEAERADLNYKNIDSTILLEKVLKFLNSNKHMATINNIDITVIAQKPRLAPYHDLMRERLARICDIDIRQINIKPTTTEGLEATGEGKALAVHAVVLLETNSKK